MSRWKEIDGFPGYEVSRGGQVRSRKRKAVVTLTPWNNWKGYPVVHLYLGRRRKGITVHRLVALAFVSGHFDGAEVNHKDGIKTNNRASNLEWVTSSENKKHAVRTGLTPPPPQWWKEKRYA